MSGRGEFITPRLRMRGPLCLTTADLPTMLMSLAAIVADFSTVAAVLLTVFYGIIVVFNVQSLLVCSSTDPGVLPRRQRPQNPPKIKTNVIEIDSNGTILKLKYCETCHIWRPPRTVHCSRCNVCVECFDHHCPWVGNCIGRRNYRIFVAFLLDTTVHSLFVVIMDIVMFIVHYLKLKRAEAIDDFAEFSKSYFDLPLVGFLVFVIFWSLCGLMCYHIHLSCSAQTTNEEKKRVYGDDHPFSHGRCFNFVYTMCAPVHPSFIRAGLRNFQIDQNYVCESLGPEYPEETPEPPDKFVPGFPPLPDGVV